MRYLNDGVNIWMNTKDRPEGMNKRGKKYFLEYKTVEKEFGRNNVILYFLITRLGMNECYSMLSSGRKQKSYIRAVKVQLKEYAVTEEWEKDFERDLNSLKRRCRHVFRIIQENIRMTEQYLYFQTIGFDRLTDFSVAYAKGEDEAADQLEKEIAEWNDAHRDAIDRYMESIKEERDNMIRHREKVAEDDKAEKKARREAKKAQTAEVREIRKNREKYRKHQRKIEKEFEQYYK